MNDNPIMQRVLKLCEMWKSEMELYEGVRIFSWVGASLVEFNMIKGFTLFQSSYEKTLDDTFILTQLPFTSSGDCYSGALLRLLTQSIEEWNNSGDNSPAKKMIDWSSSVENEEVCSSSFIRQIEDLSAALNIDNPDQKLILAIYPQQILNRELFTDWISSLLNQNISNNVRIMLYDSSHTQLFKNLEIGYPEKFRYLHPDLDISGAMDEILENAKSSEKSDPENDTIIYQQSLLKMNEAIACAHEKNMKYFSNHCLSLAQKHHWLHLESLTYFFIHTYYLSQGKHTKAAEHIQKAIEKADAARTEEIEGARDMQYQYRISKANMYFMNKEYESAIRSYRECLSLPEEGIDPLVLAGVHQMLGNAFKLDNKKQEATINLEKGWQYLETIESDILKDIPFVMSYANDLLKVLPTGKRQVFDDKFNDWWGNGWQQEVAKGQMI